MRGARSPQRQSRLRPGLIAFGVVVAVIAVLAVVATRPLGEHRADLSSYPSGITAADVARAGSLTENSNVPAAIMAALPQAYGTDPVQPARTYSDAQRSAAIANNTPIGPYQLLYNNVYAFAKAYRILPLSFNEMADPQRSGNWLVGAAAAVIHRNRLTVASVNLTAGTTDQPYFNPATNTVEQRTVVRSASADAARATVQNSWVAILSALPVAGIGSRAQGVYAAAFHWTVVGSLSQVCGGVPVTYANTGVIPVPGNWTNPVSSSRILTTFQSAAHDGVDLAATPGAPVYAATNGMVKLVGTDKTVSAVGGAHALVLYTGNGLTLAYQDLDTDAVSDGQQVRVGQLLGTVAATATDHPSSGPHLHFGINTVHAYATNSTTWVDPITFMGSRSVVLGSTGVGTLVHLMRAASTSVRTTEAASPMQGVMDVWQGSQLSAATTIISTGQRVHMTAWGIQTALMVAMQGSRLGAELPVSSGSPLGPLALPASWAPAATRNDLASAAQLFYARLVKVPGWQTISPWQAAWKTGAYASAAIESYRAKWSGAGVIMNALGTPGTTSTYGTEGTVGGGCTGASAANGPTVNLSGGFRVASFNLHGCTASGTSGPDSCLVRFPPQWSYINQHGFSIVGLQELEPPVFQLLQAKAAPGSPWAFYPTVPQYVHQQATAVLWRTDEWRFITGQSFTIPKYAWADASGTHYQMANEAMVLLQNAAGQRLWVISVHNISTVDSPTRAAFTYGQAKDVTAEAQQFADHLGTGIPVLMVGDFNDDTVYTICGIKHLSPSAHSVWDPIPAGACANPASTKGQPYEKIIGSGGIPFSGTQMDWSTQTSGMTYAGRTYGITDHGVPATIATLP